MFYLFYCLLVRCGFLQNCNLKFQNMNKINFFKGLLLVQTISLIIYTIIAFNNEGSSLFSIALTNIQSLKWSGQFNLDFCCYLTLSGLWIMWRNRFNGLSILIGCAAMILGIIFFAPYILFLLRKENGDLKKLLVGNR